MNENIVEMKNITKKFGNFYALKDVDFTVKKGEIHALLGENGAGKSTLMSILFGLYTPEEGNIYIRGEKTDISSPTAANKLSIGMVHQHFMLVHNFTALENIVLGNETTKGGVMQMKGARQKVENLCQKYNFNVPLDKEIKDITVGTQQKIEILKMLYTDSQILIFDEPTAVLTPQEIDELMYIMEQMVQEGKSIIFITHKLAEIKKIADRCTILRKGEKIATVDVSKTKAEDLSSMMVGRDIDLTVTKKDIELKDEILKVEDLYVKDTFDHESYVVNGVSFTINKGEIVSIAGIDGNGQSELIYSITGLMDIEKGKVYLGDEDITHKSIRKKYESGICHIPEDRHKYGLILDYPLDLNMVMKNYYEDRFSKNGFLKFDKITSYTEDLIEKYDIRSSKGAKSSARSMSGGNQQKAIIARELSSDKDLIVAVQPVRGLDVGAIEYIHKRLVEARDNGKAVLLMSFDLDEVLNLSDRILIMYEGKITAQLDPKKTTREEVGLYMSGSKRDYETI